jgi:hypothetical protein
MRRESISSDSVFGPIVATILVAFREFILSKLHYIWHIAKLRAASVVHVFLSSLKSFYKYMILYTHVTLLFFLSIFALFTIALVLGVLGAIHMYYPELVEGVGNFFARLGVGPMGG